MDAGVETAADEVANGVVDRDFKTDRGIFREERLDQRRQPPRCGRSRNRQAKCADRLVAKQVDAFQRVIDAHDDRLDLAEQPLAGFRQGHAPKEALAQAPKGRAAKQPVQH